MLDVILQHLLRVSRSRECCAQKGFCRTQTVKPVGRSQRLAKKTVKPGLELS